MSVELTIETVEETIVLEVQDHVPVVLTIDNIPELRDELESKVDKVEGYSLVDDAEIAKLVTVQENATANRDDSLNADKIHGHVIGDVAGLTERLNDIDAMASVGVIAPYFGVFPVNLDVENGLLKVFGAVRCYFGNKAVTVSQGEYPLPTTNSLILVDKTTGVLSFQAIVANSTIPTGACTVGSYLPRPAPEELGGFPSGYQVNGKVPDDGSSADLTTEWFGELVVADPSQINFSYERQQVEIGAGVRLIYGGVTRLLPAQVIPNTLRLTLPTRILVSTDNLSVRLDVTTSQPIPVSHVQVGTLIARPRNIHGIASYSIDGVPSSGLRHRRLRHTYVAGQIVPPIIESLVVNGTTDPGFELPAPLPEQASFLSTATHLDVYAKYDALQAAHPDYITRTLIGQDESGANVYQYNFKPTDMAGSRPSKGLAKVIAVSGVHGNEKAGVMNLYETLREICENWGDDERLETLRWNVHFIVVPIAVPWGFDNSSRQNMNGVDIARNFPSGWVAKGSPWDTDYSGTEPLSEVETRNIDAVLGEHSDAVLFSSFHNFSSSSDNFIWASSGSLESVQLAKAIISRQARIWRKRYSWFPDGYFGYTDLSAPPGSENTHGTEKYGILSCVFEVSQGVLIADAPENATYSSTATTMGVEAYVNWLLLNLDYGARRKNIADSFYTV